MSTSFLVDILSVFKERVLLFCVSLCCSSAGSGSIVTKITLLILGNGHTHGADGFHFDACVISGTPHSGATVDDEDFDGSGRTSRQRNKQQGHALETGNKTGMRNLMRSDIERKCITDESRYKQEGHN